MVSGNYINIYISKQHTHTHTPTLTLTHTVTRAAYAGSCCCCVLSALRSTTCYMHRATRRMSNKCRKQKRWNAESKPSTRMDNICVSACVRGGRGWRERVRYTCVCTLRERAECVDEVEVLNKINKNTLQRFCWKMLQLTSKNLWNLWKDLSDWTIERETCKCWVTHISSI